MKRYMISEIEVSEDLIAHSEIKVTSVNSAVFYPVRWLQKEVRS